MIDKITNPSPAFSCNNVPVALSCSEYYSLYGATFLKSLVEHSSPEYCYDILVFTKDLTVGTMQMLNSILDGYPNFSLRFLDVNMYLQEYALKVHAHFGIESYFRLLYPYILKLYQKILYFDCDMVVKNDIALLYQIDIRDSFFGACVDAVIVGAINDPEDRSFGTFGWKEYCERKLHMQNPYLYINSGVLIFNLAKFRSVYTADQVLKNVQEENYYLLDQDALNALCETNIFILDLTWNVTTNVAGTKWPYIQKAPLSVSNAYWSARRAPNTVHFADSMKPWKNPNEDLGYEFWTVARELPIYTRIVARMSQELGEDIEYRSADGFGERVSLPMGVLKEWKWTIKRWSTVILPYHSKRRQYIKRWYYKLRGWQLLKEKI